MIGEFLGVGVAEYFDRRVRHPRHGRRQVDAETEAVLTAGH